MLFVDEIRIGYEHGRQRWRDQRTRTIMESLPEWQKADLGWPSPDRVGRKRINPPAL